MSDTGVDWSDEQWHRVRQAVHDEAMRARVAGSFLPLYGPLDETAETVPAHALSQAGDGTARHGLSVNDHDVIHLSTLAVNVEVRNRQAADPDLESALILFRRAATIVARVEDAILFNGQPGRHSLPPSGTTGLPAIFTVTGGGQNAGLMQSAALLKPKAAPATGPQIFSAIVSAIEHLEGLGQFGPYAVVMGSAAFTAVHEALPQSMVLPRDSILPYIRGPLLRSSSIDAKDVLVVAMQNEPVEIVVGKDVSVKYLQTTPEASHLFRVSERFALRIKDPGALARFSMA